MIKYAQTSLLNIAYFEHGESNKPAVLLLHGWPDDANAWQTASYHIAAAGYRVIVPWLRGFGQTSFNKATTPRTGNPGIIALDLIEFLDELQLDKFSVIGQDWGSNIAEALAVGWPERVIRMAQLSSPPRIGGMATPSFKHAQLDWYHWFMATKRGEQAVRNDPIAFAHLMWVNWSPKGWFNQASFSLAALSWKNPDFVDVTIHSYRSRWEEALPDQASIKLEEKILATQTLSIPALFIQGEADGVNPPYVSEKVHEKFTGPFQRILIPGVGHFLSREAPETISNHLIDFLKKS